MKIRVLWMCFAGAMLTMALQIPCIAQEAMPALPSQYAATAIGQAGAVAGKSFALSVYVDGVTSDGEVSELASVLKSKGQDGLLKAFGDLKDKGRLSPTGSVGTGMRFIRIYPTANGGQKIVLATDRPISFGELYNMTRTTDYPFSIVVLNLDKDGKGTGSFAPLCKVRFNKKNQLEIEHWGQKPFRLANVYKEK
jgi:hypothetical protein